MFGESLAARDEFLDFNHTEIITNVTGRGKLEGIWIGVDWENEEGREMTEKVREKREKWVGGCWKKCVIMKVRCFLIL